MLNSLEYKNVDLEFVKNYLKVDFDEDDVLISTFILGGKSYIESFLNRKIADFGTEVPQEFTIALLGIVAHWYDERKMDGADSEQMHMFTNILTPYRYWNGGVS